MPADTPIPTDPGETRTGFWGPEDSVDLLQAAVERLRAGTVPPEVLSEAVVTCLALISLRVQAARRVPWAEVGDLARSIVEAGERR
jgi:hypothetical protein